jgi:hypothetical protein
VDLGKYALGHITKITLTLFKKYELYAMVSTVTVVNMNDKVNMHQDNRPPL